MWLHPLQLPALWSRDSGLAAGAAADARGARVDAVREGGIVSCGAAAWREACKPHPHRFALASYSNHSTGWLTPSG